MGYQISEIRWYKEDTVGQKPASPSNLLIKPESFQPKEDQKSEIAKCLGAGGEPSGKIYGDSDYTADLSVYLSGDFMPVILHHLIGDITSVSDATSNDWAADTAYVKGDIVNHSDGSHSLVALQTGTSGSSEPDLTNANNNDVITDGTVKWVVKPRLKKYTGKRTDCVKSFGIETTLKDNCNSGASDIKTRLQGAFLTSFEFGKTADMVSAKSSTSIVSYYLDNSITNDNYEAQGGTDTALEQVYYGKSDITILLDGVEPTMHKEAKVSFKRPVILEPTIKDNEKIEGFDIIEATGNLSCVLSADTFKRGELHEVKKLQIIYEKNGEKATITFNRIVFDKDPIEAEVGKSAMINGTFTAVGDQDLTAVEWECISGLQNY